MTMTRDFRLTESARLLARAEKTVPGGVHSNVRLGARPHPLFFSRAEGSRLWDVDGNEYIDYVLGQGPMILGHCHPAVVEAVAHALRSGQLYAGQHLAEVELAELVTEVVPCAEKVRFSTTGTEGIQAAVRIARAATDRVRIVKFEGHYNGSIDNIYLNLSPSKLREVGELVPETRGQVAPLRDHVSVIPWNDVGALKAEVSKGDLAAVVMEPIGANQAVILPEPGYLEAVRTACSEHGTVLIFDEVITGFRVALGGAQELLGVVPDLAVFGKAMASGFPIACVAGRTELFDGVATGGVTHAGTFNGNVASITAALATVRTLRDQPDLHRAAKAAGERLINGIQGLRKRDVVVQGLPEVVWVGFGSGTVKSVRDLSSFDQSNLLGFDESKVGALSGELLKKGVHTTTRGTWYISCVHSEDEIDQTIEAFAEAVENVSEG